MNVNAMWSQREGIATLVNESPTIVTIFRQKLIPNGMGELTPDPCGEPYSLTVKFRIAHEKKSPPEPGTQNGTFYTSDYNRIATWTWDTDIRSGDAYTDPEIGRRFVFGRVDPLRIFGGIIGYQASIIEAASWRLHKEVKCETTTTGRVTPPRR